MDVIHVLSLSIAGQPNINPLNLDFSFSAARVAIYPPIDNPPINIYTSFSATNGAF